MPLILSAKISLYLQLMVAYFFLGRASKDLKKKYIELCYRTILRFVRIVKFTFLFYPNPHLKVFLDRHNTDSKCIFAVKSQLENQHVLFQNHVTVFWDATFYVYCTRHSILINSFIVWIVLLFVSYVYKKKSVKCFVTAEKKKKSMNTLYITLN